MKRFIVQERSSIGDIVYVKTAKMKKIGTRHIKLEGCEQCYPSIPGSGSGDEKNTLGAFYD
jgi:hypothetical protein